MLRIVLVTIVFLLGISAETFAATTVSGDSQINRCEQKSYTITLTNNTGNPADEIVVTSDLSLLGGFAYVADTSAITTTGNSQNCNVGPVNPLGSGTTHAYNLDTLCGTPFTLDDTASLTITYDLITDCTAVSGSKIVDVDYQISGTPGSESTQFSIEVLPGAATIKKTPSVQSAAVGDNVTWTISIENTGLGIIQNVNITDLLGSGLAYVSSSPAGTNSGQTTTWGPAQVAGLALMNPGEVVTVDIEAQVISCEGLDNTADVSFGCNSGQTCFDTSSDGGTATASIQRIVRTPLLGFTPPPITFNYCGSSNPDPINVVIANSGDGVAYEVQTIIDFDPLTVSNVSAGASYDAGQNAFILDPGTGILNGGSYTLQFTLEQPDWCSDSLPGSPLLWQKIYEDECGNQFYPPAELSTLTAPADTPTVSVTKTGAPAAIQIGDTISYTITSSYSGTTNCDGNNTGNVTVTDTVPDGFTVSNSGGGIWTPGTGGTGGEIVWTYTPPASLNTSIELQSPDTSQCETVCYTTFTNSVIAEVTDCCGCALSDTASQTTAIECDVADVNSDKTVAPASAERCDILTYTNTYTFGATSNIELNELQLTEQAENGQTYQPGSLQILLDGTDQSCGTPTQAAAGAPVAISLANCPATDVTNSVLEIIYELEFPEDTGSGRCSDLSFYSWSSLNLGPDNGGGVCLVDDTIHETTEVFIESPKMSLNLSGLGNIIETCEAKTVNITLAQTSTIANPRDTRLVLSGLNYYAVDPTLTTCSGSVTPTSCNPVIVGDDYVWFFEDGFSGAGQNATIELEVQKRCGGTSELEATVYYDDQCSDDTSYDDGCSLSASDTPALLTSGDLLITKTPEVYHAETNQVEWTIYLTNRGTGIARNVWIDDVLGSGMILNLGSTVVDPDNGDVTINANLDHEGGAINGVSISIDSMAPGEKREITVMATLVDCTNLTNDVSASWGCIGVQCQVPVTDSSTVVIPTPNLVYTGVYSQTSLAPCSSYDGTITAKNAGQTAIYNLQLSQTLPTGMNYINGTTRWRLNGGAWNGPNAAYDPSPVTSPIRWTDAEIPQLADLAPGDQIEIEYLVDTECSWNGGNAVLSGQYENPCGQVYSGGSKTFALSVNELDLSIDKHRTNPPEGQPLSCGQAITWEVDVTNNSGFTAEVIRITDTVGNGFNTISTPDSNGTVTALDEIQWEIGNLAAGATTTLTVQAQSDAGVCDPDLDNTVYAHWGCGLANGNPQDDTGLECLSWITFTDTHESTREPTTTLTSLSFSPGSLDACNDSTQVTLVFSNDGPTDAFNLDLVLDLPTGLTYNTGTAQFGIGTDQASAITAIAGVGDPAISGSTLSFYDQSDPGNNLTATLQANGGNDTAVLRFTVQSSCYTDGDIDGELFFFDCCGTDQHSDSFSQPLDSNEPDLTVTKTPVTSQIECSDTTAYTITVTNNGSGNAQVVRLEDQPGSWLDVIGGASSDNVTNMGGGVYGWEFNNLGPGASISRTLTVRLSPDAPQSDCSAALRQNNARAVWACGVGAEATDGDPTTQGYDCQNNTFANAPTTELQMPDLEITDISPQISCGPDDGTITGSVNVTVLNSGDGATLSDFTVQVTIDGVTTYTGAFSGTLAAGESTTITIDTTGWNPDCKGCVPYVFEAEIDPANAVCECNESNNTATFSNYIAPIPKLAITDITAVPSCNAESFVDVTVANQGCSAVTGSVTIELTGDITGTGSAGPIPAGDSETVRISLGNLDCETGYAITATVDPGDTICECNDTNHSLSTNISVPCCSIDLEKSTNGFDADNPTGPFIPDGNTVTWAYLVTNTGSTAINSINLNDNQIGVISCPSTSLAAGLSMTCTTSSTVNPSMGDQYSNNATVTGTPVDGGGSSIGNDLSDSDPSHFYRLASSIDIEKLTNTEDADSPTGPLIRVGEPVQWEYIVTNTGNTIVTNATVTDDREGPISCPQTTLAVGESMICTVNATALAGQYSNTATVTGSAPDTSQVTDTDPSNYFGVNALIDLEKTTNGVDADNPPGPYIAPTEPVNWVYTVTNTGNVSLSDISVIDDQGVVITCPSTLLPPGDSMDCTGAGISDTPQYMNLATVTGRPPSGDDVSDSDPSHYYSEIPSITIEKTTNGEDADFPEGPVLIVGDTVTWTYTVTNTGAVLINNIVVSDDQGVSVNCPQTSLDPGERMTCTGTGIAEAGQYANIATVIGDPIAGPQVTDSDPSHYFARTKLSGPPFLPPGREDGETEETPPVDTGNFTPRLDYEDCCLSADKELIGHTPPVRALSVHRELYYHTYMAMYLAYELSGLDTLADRGSFLPDYKLLAQRNGLIERAKRAGISNVGTLSMRSGLGLGMNYAPSISGSDRPQEVLRSRITDIARKTGWRGDIGTVQPLLLEFHGAIPQKRSHDDLIWDQSGMDTSLSPLSWGMTLLAESTELERLQSSDSADNPFIADLLLWQIEEKIALFSSYLKGRPEGSKYFAHRFALPEGDSFTLEPVDNSYYLVDQAALLLGLSRLSISLQDSDITFAADLDTIRKTLWETMESRINAETGVWLSTVQAEINDESTQGQVHNVIDLLFATLAADMAEKADDSWFGATRYKNRIKKAVSWLSQKTDEAGLMGDTISADGITGEISFSATIALARMEMLIGEKDAAIHRFLAAERKFRDDTYHLYRPYAVFDKDVHYNPVTIANYTGFLREAVELDLPLDKDTLDKGLAFIDRILFQGGLQIEATEYALKESHLLLAQDDHIVIPLLLNSDDTLRYGSLPPVAVNRIALNLPQRFSTDMDEISDLMPDKAESLAAAISGGKTILFQHKDRTIETGDASLALMYLDDTSTLLQKYRKPYENPYFFTLSGSAELAGESERIWKSNLFSIAFNYGRGIPLTSHHVMKNGSTLTDETSLYLQQKHLPTDTNEDNGGKLAGTLKPLFIEFDKGEPFDSSGIGTGWSGTLPDETVSVLTLAQVERAKIRFLKDLLQTEDIDNSAASSTAHKQTLREFLKKQLESKMDFSEKLVAKTAANKREFLPRTFRLIRDSRDEIIDIELDDEPVEETGQLAFILYLLEYKRLFIENNVQEGKKSKQAESTMLQDSLHSLFSLDAEHQRLGVKNSLLKQALTLDLLAQLSSHDDLGEDNQTALTQLISGKTEKIVSLLKKNQSLNRLLILGHIDPGRNQLAAYAGIIRALIRIDTLGLDTDLKESIRALAVDFDKRFWNEGIGGYHAGESRFTSQSFRSRSYLYSELDIALTVSALAGSLNYLDEHEQKIVASHLAAFGQQMLVHRELTTSVLNGLRPSYKSFDMEIVQDMDIIDSVSTNLHAGDVVRYQINVYNRCKPGQANPPLNDVRVTDILPNGVSYIPGTTEISGDYSPDPAIVGNSLLWTIERLDDHAAISFSVHVPDDFSSQSLHNRLEVSTNVSDESRPRLCSYNHEVITPLTIPDSSLDVVYFNDTNLNKTFDPGETRQHQIQTLINGKREETADDGSNRYTGLIPGWYSISPDWQTTDVTLVPTEKTPLQTVLRDNEHKSVDIGLIQFAEAEGWVYDDRNNNGSKEIDEPGLAHVRIQVADQPGYYAYSGRDGYYRIERIPMAKRFDTHDVELSKIQPYTDIESESLGSGSIGIIAY